MKITGPLLALALLTLAAGCKSEDQPDKQPSKDRAIPDAGPGLQNRPKLLQAKLPKLLCPAGAKRTSPAIEPGSGKLLCCLKEDGTRHGPCSFSDPAKGLRGTIGFWNGIPHGRWITIQGDHKAVEIGFEQGLASGTWAGWYDDGSKMSEAPFKDGKPHGEWMGWYSNGQKAKQAKYKAGKLDGSFRYWDRQGKPITEAEFKQIEHPPGGVQPNVFDAFR